MQPFDYPVPEIRTEVAVFTDFSRFKLGPNSAVVLLSDSTMPIPAHWQERFNMLKSLQPESDHWLVQTGGLKPALILLCELKTGLSPFEQLTHARKTLSGFTDYAVDELAFYVAHPESSWLDAFVSAHLAARFNLPSYKQEAKQRQVPRSLVVASSKPLDINIDRLLCEAIGNALARHLSVTPASELTPEIYRAYALKLALEHQWQTDWFSQERLEDMGAGAFLAVSQGSPGDRGGILKLSYRPANYSDNTKTVALVGKGLCFDTGGYNLKTGGFMYGMHLDMGGSAVALGSLLALTLAKAPIAVDCYLALAENHIGPEAYKPNDLVTALNGTTIEVVDTDAEGRMVLADTLTLASTPHADGSKPDLVIDYATLTGACMRALGKNYSGAFTNQPQWYSKLIELGQRCGERIWPFPLDADYDDNIKSDIADVLQCAPSSSPDHIDAARFLSRFVEPDTPWLHLDLSAFKPKSGLAHVPGDVSGFGVRLTMETLLGENSLVG